MIRIAIVGAGGHAREAVEAARAAGHQVECLLDDDPKTQGTEVLGVQVAEGGIAAAGSLDSDVQMLVAVGDNRARQQIVSALTGRTFATLVHPFSWISPTAEIGAGTVIFAGCVVQTGVRIGPHAILNTGATVSHDCVVGGFSHVAVGAHLAGAVTVGDGALIGAGASARPGTSIGKWATVGAGSTVVADIPDGTVVFGDGNARPR